jgi:transcriptional regulator with GAF, ATPase, and Fis domain
LPPLRDRKEDIPLLAQHFIGEFNKKHGTNVEALREDALEMLMNYSWPGNVREFRNVMERALILSKSEWIETFHLPPYLRHPGMESSSKIVLPLGITAAEAERELILKTLEKTGHNKAEAGASTWPGCENHPQQTKNLQNRGLMRSVPLFLAIGVSLFLAWRAYRLKKGQQIDAHTIHRD